LDTWESEQPTWTETVKVLRHYSEAVNSPTAEVAAHIKKRKVDETGTFISDISSTE